jgi:hypothetical protein
MEWNSLLEAVPDCRLDLDKCDHVRVLGDDLLEDRGDGAAPTAPLRPEVDKYRLSEFVTSAWKDTSVAFFAPDM